MTPERVAALPMYDFPDVAAAHDALWGAIAERLQQAGLDAPRTLVRDLPYTEVWCHPGLVFGQACEYPLAKSYGDRVRLVATPGYEAPGCVGFRYSSCIVVRRDDAAVSVEDLRRRRCVVNQPDSNSGMNLLRAAIAPHARGARFFESVQTSGSHRQSAVMVAGGEADVAAVDCVTYAHLARCEAPLIGRLRILARTPPSPALPFITSRTTDDAMLAVMRAVLREVSEAPGLQAARRALYLAAVDCEPDAEFTEIRELERRAEQLDYPLLI